MIFEEIFMIDHYFHKLNQTFFLFRISVMRTVMTQCFSFPNLGVKHGSENDASKLFIFLIRFFHGEYFGWP